MIAKYTIFLLLSVLFWSCQTKRQFDTLVKSIRTISTPASIDSSFFAKSLEYEKVSLKKIDKKFEGYFNIEDLAEKHGEKFLFEKYFFGKISINEDVVAILIYAPRNREIPLDALVERIYLITFNKVTGKPIDSLPIASYESHFDTEIVTECYLFNNQKIRTKQTKYFLDETDNWTLQHSDSSEYHISMSGKINNTSQN